jgi:hypothetical protein
MTFTREQKQIAYKQLPEEVQEIIMSNQTTELISKYLREIGLTPEEAEKADSEILYAMYGMQTLEKAIGNIAASSSKGAKEMETLKNNLNDNIFTEINKILSNPLKQPSVTENQENKQVKEPGAFVITQETKKAVVEELAQRMNAARQAGAPSIPKIISKNLPMVEKGEVAHDVPHVEPAAPATVPPSPANPAASTSPQPVKPEAPKAAPVTYTKYTPGNDPYREPIN